LIVRAQQRHAMPLQGWLFAFNLMNLVAAETGWQDLHPCGAFLTHWWYFTFFLAITSRGG